MIENELEQQSNLVEAAVMFLKKWATGKVVLGLFVVTMSVYLTMLFYTLPIVESHAPGKALFDLSPGGYSYDYALSLLQTLGTAGRHSYLTIQMPLDLIYPGLFAISNTLLIVWLFEKGFETSSRILYLAFIPFFGGLFDYLENIGIILMLQAFPEVSPSLVKIASAFTILKSGFTTAFFILLFVGLAVLFKKFFTHHSARLNSA